MGLNVTAEMRGADSCGHVRTTAHGRTFPQRCRGGVARPRRMMVECRRPMADQSSDLKGWKEIAAYLKTSERTVRRWETTRHLPVRRVPGLARDMVLCRPQELDAWLAAPGARNEGTDSAEEPRPRARRRAYLAGGVLAAGLLVMVALAFYSQAAETSRQARRPFSAERANAVVSADAVPTLLLRVSLPEGWNTNLRTPAGQQAGFRAPGKSLVTLRPLVDSASLVVEIATTTDSASPRPLRVSLLLGQSVPRPDPYPFDIEWVGTLASPKRGGPAERR